MTTLVPILLLPLIGAALAPILPRILVRGPSAIAALASASALAMTALQIPAVASGETPTAQMTWVPSLGLALALRMDGLALTFALLILAIGLLVSLYARYYMPIEAPRGRFFALLLCFQAAMLGIVLSDNLLLLLVFWELTSLTSFFLIGYDPSTGAARRGAAAALIVTAIGGLALLAGFLLLGTIVGSLSLAEVLASGEQIRQDPLHIPVLLLILLGVFTKSAQVPFHFWLPSAMAAPTPVSAYLHSATMVKGGVFLLARLFPVFSDSPAWFPIVGLVGISTFVFAAYVALFKHDIKGLLAYSTISHLGLITFLFGLGTPLGAVAGLFHALNHAVFKASLFMAAGIIDHQTGTRDMRQINGLYACLPITGTLAMVAAAAMAGVPLLNGFLSKEMFFAETVDPDISAARLGAAAPLLHMMLPVAAILGGLFSVAYSLRFIHDVFFNGPLQGRQCPPEEPHLWMRVPIAILVAVCVLVGIFPQQTVRPILEVASRGMLGFVPAFHLSLWQGMTPAVLMSIAALSLGGIVYSLRRPLFKAQERWLRPPRGEVLFQRTGEKSIQLAGRMLPLLQTASVSQTVAWLMLSALAMGLTGWIWSSPGTVSSWDLRPALPLDLPSLALAAMLGLGAWATVRYRQERIYAVVLSGVVGLVISLAFVHFSAPDLAMTQLSVEIVTTLLLLVVLGLLPPPAPRSKRARFRAWHLLLAAAAGLGASTLAAVMMMREHTTISDWYLRMAEPAADATNVVNAILVDFRALDTLGEITVLAIAAVAIAAMLPAARAQPSRPRAGSALSPEALADERRHPLMLTVPARVLLPIALMVSAFLLLRGHHAPGGGFVAGLVAATALVLQWMARGDNAEVPRYSPGGMIGLGLLIALGTGVATMLLGWPLLTGATLHCELPMIGTLGIPSSLGFDIGVMLSVAGVVLLVFERLAAQPSPAAREREDT